MPPGGPDALKLARFAWLWRHRSKQRQPVQDNAPSHSRLVAAKGIDLDSLEEMMNRRLRNIWLRHAWFVVFLGGALVAGLIGISIFFSIKPTVYRIAVGPAGSDDVTFAEKLGERMKAERSGLRIEPIIKQGPVSVSDIHGTPEFDLAVVRGNMALSSDWPVVAILRQNVVALIVPAPGARAPLKNDKGKVVKPSKIGKVSDLAGKRVGIVTSTDGGPELLQVILQHYGIPLDKVQASEIAIGDLKSAIHDNKIDVVLVAGPQTGKAIEDAVVAASTGKEGPTFVPIDQAEGIGKRTPPYDKIDIPAGAFGGVPPVPAEELTTMSYPLYLVAREDLNEDKVATLAKLVYTSRQTFAYQLPGVIAIASPSTDKDAAVLVHNGAAAYLGDNQKTFFDRYGDQIFYGLLIFPIIGSALAGVAGYFRADKNSRRIRQLHRLLQLVRKARTLTSIEELDRLQDEADAILGDIIQQSERGQLDETGLATYSLVIDQARHALSEQRSMLVLRPENVPRHELAPHGNVAAE